MSNRKDTKHPGAHPLFLAPVERMLEEDINKLLRLKLAIHNLKADERYVLRNLVRLEVEFHDNGNVSIIYRCAGALTQSYQWIGGPAWRMGFEDARQARDHASLELLRNMFGFKDDADNLQLLPSTEPSYDAGYKAGLPPYSLEEIEERVEAWHDKNLDTPGTLAEFLGMSDKQYDAYVTQGFTKPTAPAQVGPTIFDKSKDEAN